MVVKQTYGKDDKQPYQFTGLQILRIETRTKVTVYRWEWNSVDGFKVYSGSTGKPIKRPSKKIMNALKLRKDILLHPFFVGVSVGGVEAICNILEFYVVSLTNLLTVWRSTRVKTAMLHVLRSGKTTLELNASEKAVLRLRYGYTYQ